MARTRGAALKEWVRQTLKLEGGVPDTRIQLTSQQRLQ